MVTHDVVAGIPEESLTHHRYSISSDEYNGLDQSASSLRNDSRTKRALSKITNRLPFMGGTATSALPETIWTAKTNFAYDTRLLYKRRITTMYTSFTSLRSYVEINYAGFRKILKK